MEHDDLSSEMPGQPDEEGDASKQGRPARNRKSNARQSSDDQLKNLGELIGRALMRDPECARILATLDPLDKIQLKKMAWNKFLACPCQDVECLFWKWASHYQNEDVLNYAAFGRWIGKNRMYVSRTVIPLAIDAFVAAAQQAVPLFLIEF